MNKQNITIAAMAAFLVIGMTAMAFAGPAQGRGNNRGYGYHQNMWSQLTPEKQQAVEVIVNKYDAKFDELRTQLWAKHATLQALVNGGNADEKKIAGLTADIAKLRNQLRDTRDNMRAELEKETGLVAYGPGFGGCSGFAGGRGYGMGGNYGHMGGGYGMGNGPGMGYGMGYGPGMTN